MAYYVDAAILTKSTKLRGYCVAGVGINNGRWVRFVSSDEESHGAVFNHNMKYCGGGYCEPFDIVRVPVIKKLDHAYQPENILIDENRPWRKLGTFSVSQLLALHPPELHVRLFGSDYSYSTKEELSAAGYSLALIEVSDMIIRREDLKKPKAEFIYRDTNCRFVTVTDPDYCFITGSKSISHALLVMSIPNFPYKQFTFEERYYKLIAKVIPL